MDTIAVLGAGAWGTALANVAARRGGRVVLWTRSRAQALELARERENMRHLPGIRLADGIEPTADLDRALTSPMVLVAVPAQQLRAVLSQLAPFHLDTRLVICAKGIELGTGLLMSEVSAQCLPGCSVAILSGPSFAADVARGKPVALVLAAKSLGVASQLAGRLAATSFRIYFTDDVRGVEIGGAAKNVLAIACGVAAGLDLGPSAVAGLVARGFAELLRFGGASGAKTETLTGLSGLGDLVLTCSGPQSRNFALGLDLGRGKPFAEAGVGRLAEGVPTSLVLRQLARERGVDTPIVDRVAALVSGTLDPQAALDSLLARPFRSEGGDTPLLSQMTPSGSSG